MNKYLLSVIVACVAPAWTFAQEDAEGLLSETGDTGQEVVFKSQFAFENFQNQTLDYWGYLYGGQVMAASPGDFMAFVGISVLNGEVRGLSVQELGNPYFGAELLSAHLGGVDWWMQLRIEFAQGAGKLAARHDTYRVGTDFRFQRRRLSIAAGFGYRLRVNETDSRFNLGNVTDGHAHFTYPLTPKWWLNLSGDAYQAEAASFQGQRLADSVRWAGISPGIRYRLGAGVDLGSALTFPVLHSHEREEMELFFWDIGYPTANEVTLRTDLGVTF